MVGVFYQLFGDLYFYTDYIEEKAMERILAFL